MSITSGRFIVNMVTSKFQEWILNVFGQIRRSIVRPFQRQTAILWLMMQINYYVLDAKDTTSAGPKRAE